MPRPIPLHVEGTHLSEEGHTVRLQGIRIPSFESSTAGEFVFRSARVALEDWHANCVRLPLCQDRWFGKESDSRDRHKGVDDGVGYRSDVDEVVTLVLKRGGYVVLDLAWSDAGAWGQNLGPHEMPDENSLKFWRDVARVYRDEPHVIFGLFESPSPVSGDVWLRGGDIVEGSLSYHSPGFQILLDEIRKVGAKNVILVKDSAASLDLSSATADGLHDPKGAGVVYDLECTHDDGPSVAKIKSVEEALPLVVSVGLIDGSDRRDPASFPDSLFAFLRDRDLSWIAGSFNPAGTSPLIADWTYKPSSSWGLKVKRALGAINSSAK